MDEEDKKTCRMISKMIEADDLSGLSRHLPFVRFLRDHAQNRSVIPTFLDQACQKDSAAVADIFLEFFDVVRDLPLFERALKTDNIKVIKLLLPIFRNKAYSRNHEKWLNEAALRGSFDTAQILLTLPLSQEAKTMSLCFASWVGHMMLTQKLAEEIDQNTPLNKPLHQAAMAGHKDVLLYLLPRADPKSQNSRALQLASMGGHVDVFNILYPLSDPLMALLDLGQNKAFDYEQHAKLLLDRLKVENDKRDMLDKLDHVLDESSKKSGAKSKL